MDDAKKPEKALEEPSLSWSMVWRLLLLVLPVLVPLMTTLLPGGHDVLEYLPRLVEFHENIRHGILIPRWAPSLSAGHGQPFFIMAPPMLYYLGELGLLVGLGPVVALNITCMVLVVISAWAMFLLCRHFFGANGGWLGAAAYVYAPYFHIDLFTRHAWAELAAFAFYPLALLGFARLAREGKKTFMFVGAASYAATILCHFPAALIFSVLLAAFAAFLAWRERSWRVLTEQAVGLLLGLALAAFSWLPALIELRYTQVDALRTGALHYSNHFVIPNRVFSTGYGFQVHGNAVTLALGWSLGWTHLMLGALALGLAARRLRAERALVGFPAVSAVVLSFLTTPASRLVWDHVPLIAYMQFPWRLLASVATCLAVLVAALGPALPTGSTKSRILLLVVLALVMVPNIDHIGVDRYYEIDLTGWTPESIARRGTAATYLDEYRPRWVETSIEFRAQAVVVLEGRARVEVERPTPIRWQMDVDADTEALLELRCFDFPGWEVRIDGERIAAERAPLTGRLRFRVPAGEHRVEALFRRTAVRWMGEGVSLAAALLLGLALAREKTKRVQSSG